MGNNYDTRKNLSIVKSIQSLLMKMLWSNSSVQNKNLGEFEIRYDAEALIS